jgi:acyl carrier protein
VGNEALGEEVAAAVVLRPQHTATEPELREFVTKRLADFKVPRQILILTEIPKGSFGKIERHHLAERLGVKPCDQLPSKPEVAYTPPSTREESMLAEIWARVLGLNVVGIHDDFFQLGGDSILATRVVSQVRSLLKVELSPASLFEAPTVAELARSLQISGKKGEDPAIRPIKPIPRN